MPTALENLVRILKLEREQGCENTAVEGGLAAYSATWGKEAREQARHAEHHALAEEIEELLQQYEDISNRTRRMKKIRYMLDRITGRKPAPPRIQKRISELEKQPQKSGGRQQKQKEKQRSNRSKRSQPAARSQSDDSEFPDPYDDQSHQSSGEMDIPPMPRLARPPRRKRPQISLDEALKRQETLQDSIMQVKGIGSGIARRLERLEIRTVEDMLSYLPRRYDDYTALAYISQLKPEQVTTVIGTIEQTQVRQGKNNRRDFAIRVSDGSGSMEVVFFGQHFLSRQLHRGKQVVLSGKVTIYRNTFQMANPEWEFLDAENLHTVGIVPVYPLKQDIGARFFRRSMKKTLDAFADEIPDHIPQATLDRTDLADIGWAIRQLHFPDSWDHLEHARRRYIFDELLTLQLGILQNRRNWQSVPGPELQVTDDFLETFISSVFPYTLTGAQQRAVADIRRDVTQPVPMNRLIQGDVGSGKTAVATVAIGMALHNEKQAALMAPTSILAEQHYRGISATLAQMPTDRPPVIALLTGSLTKSERESIYRGMADGSIDVVIGTHALIQEGVEFNDLAVAIIDEQHRFGVEQRGALRGKGSNPHLLVMTATPIPRTLALTMYADLDLSIIDEKPPGRQPVETQILRQADRERAFQFIEAQIKQGRQAFIVHPLVEASETIETRSAVEAYEELSQMFHRYRVCLLHGRMSPAEKDDIMAAFARHEHDIMVTTSVAEVGVDVPNASVIMIEGANRFGLAQLHQFRGRVGRGDHPSFCLLLPDAPIPDDVTPDMPLEDLPDMLRRLVSVEKTNDGFELAEMDWQMRGAGDLLGTRQSGSQTLQLAEAMTPELVTLAQREALTLYEDDPALEKEEHALLAARVQLIQSEEMDVS